MIVGVSLCRPWGHQRHAGPLDLLAGLCRAGRSAAAAVLLLENRWMTKLWMLDELAHAGPEHLDPAFVAGYERKQGFPDPAEDLACSPPMAWTRPPQW
jgi:hypothetical protein